MALAKKLINTLVIAVSAMILSPTADGGIVAPPTQPVEIVSVWSGSEAGCMDVQNVSTLNTALVQQYMCLGYKQTNQIWQFVPVTSGWYNIVSKNSGKCLDVRGGPSATGNGVALQQYACLGPNQTNQLWQVVDPGTGTYQLISKSSGKCVDVTGGMTSQTLQSGVALQQYQCLGASQKNQLWTFRAPPSSCGDFANMLNTVGNTHYSAWSCYSGGSIPCESGPMGQIYQSCYYFNPLVYNDPSNQCTCQCYRGNYPCPN